MADANIGRIFVSIHLDIQSKAIYGLINNPPYVLRTIYCPSPYNIADIGTKPTTRVIFERLP